MSEIIHPNFDEEVGGDEEVDGEWVNGKWIKIEDLPYEILYQILFPMSYDHVISYCRTSKNAYVICNDDSFWIGKIDSEFSFTNSEGHIFRPSDYIAKYQHPDRRGIDIYKRWNLEWFIFDRVKNNHNDIVMWTIDTTNTPHPQIITHAVLANNTEILLLLADRGELPTQMDADKACSKGYIYLVRWLIEHEVFPHNATWAHISGVNLAAEHGYFDIMELLERNGLLPNTVGANSAAGEGQLDVLEWLAKRNIFPDKTGAHGAAINNHLNVLKWLGWKRRNVFNRYTANLAAGYGYLDIVKWLASRKIFPTFKGYRYAIEGGHNDVVRWLQTQGITYD